MKKILLCMLFLLPLSTTLAQDKKPPVEKKEYLEDKIRQLVEDLGDDSYELREKAQKALEKIGKPALEALRKAYKSADLEMASRAEELMEKITGRKFQPKSKPKDEPSVPRKRIIPETPEVPFSPDDIEKLLEKLDGFGELSPGLKDTLDSIRKFLKDGKDGTPDIGEMKKLFEKFFDKKVPPLPRDAWPLPEPKQSTIEKELGLKVKPIDDVLRAHLNISPRSGSMPPLMLKYGLVIENIDPNGHAFTQGLRKHDILIFMGSRPAPKTPLPGPEVEWNKWRSRAIIIGKPEQLESLKTKKVFIEVIRKGKSCRVVEIKPLTPKTPDSKKSRDF